MNATEVLTKLQSLGTEQTRKTYARHGVTGDCYGVSFAELEKLRKQIKKDHELARELWFSGVFDAGNLATMIADPEQMTAAECDRWVRAAKNYAMSSLLARNVAGKTEHREAMIAKWTASPKEFVAATGFDLLAVTAMDDTKLPDSYFESWLTKIESQIHSAQNRVRHSMNNVVIAIGGRNGKLQEAALATAGRIGKVEVDHGDTSCKTPDAAAYILKRAARAKPRKKAAGC
jgi:3-methyladenine DNA glycosylase AlkD